MSLSIQEAQEVLGQKFLMQEGITGVSHINESEKIVVYVETQHRALRVPKTLLGYPVQVRVTGTIKALPAPYLPPAKIGTTLAGLTGSRSSRWRPAAPGVSIGHYSISAGTFGMVVYDIITMQKLILSNNHVLAAVNKGRPGDTVLQPGKYDGGRDPGDRYATLERFVEIRPEPASNLVDCAVARPINDADVSDEVVDVGPFRGVGEAQIGMRVYKSGRTTSYMEADIIDVNATVKVNMGDWGNALFEDQVLSEVLGKPGDSGSGIGEVGPQLAVCLLYAGSDQVTAMNKIQHVFNGLNVSLTPGGLITPPGDVPWNLAAMALGGMPLIAVGTVIGSREAGEWWEQVRPR